MYGLMMLAPLARIMEAKPMSRMLRSTEDALFWRIYHLLTRSDYSRHTRRSIDKGSAYLGQRPVQLTTAV